jgi:hypothetical protein
VSIYFVIVYLNNKACPDFIISSFHNSFQYIQLEAPDYISYFKKKSPFLTKHLQQRNESRLRGVSILMADRTFEGAFLFAFLYLYKHLAWRIKVLNYNWANHCLTPNFKCPCSTTTSTIHAVVFQNYSSLLAYQLHNPNNVVFTLGNDKH